MPSEKLNMIENGLPIFLKRSTYDLYGWRVHCYPTVDDPVKHTENIRDFHLREDDVIVVAYPRSGTHWVWEIIHMLLHQTTEHEKRTKENLMLDITPNLENFNSEPSPRIFNSHLVFRHLPQSIPDKRTKIVHLIRNPKDVLVSMYHQHRCTIDFSIQAFIDSAVQDKLMYPSQFDFLRQMSEFQKKHPEHPILQIYYEEMNNDPDKIIHQLARFLSVKTSETFLRDVRDACRFDVMKKLEMSDQKQLPESLARLTQGHNVKLTMIRKGIVGDWKNELTNEQNDQLDGYITRETEKGLDFKFIYE